MQSNADQLKLLELQGLDSQLARLRHERQTDPSIAVVTDLERKLADLNKSLATAKIAVADQTREVAKVQGFIDEANARLAKHQQKIDKGDLDYKDTTAVSGEMTNLVARIADLEDQQLEVMERLENCQAAEAQVAAATARVSDDLARTVALRDARLGEITNQGRAIVGQRDALAKTIAPPLVAAYDKLRVHLNGVGAARYWGERCEGCGLPVSPSEQEALKNATPDAVTHCEECGRILIRVPQ